MGVGITKQETKLALMMILKKRKQKKDNDER